VTDEEIRSIAATAPARRRLQARAAITGTAEELIGRVHAVRSVPFGNWQASLSVRYLLDFAARHRPPDQVATLADRYRNGFDADVVLDAAATRPPAELAAIMAELDRLDDTPADHQAKPSGLAESLLKLVTARRVPADLAALLDALSGLDELTRKACETLVLSAPYQRVAPVALYLRGMAADQALAELLAAMTRYAPSGALAAFLGRLLTLKDEDSVRAVIAAAAAWQVRSDADQTAVPDVGRIAQLVQDLLESRNQPLAQQLVDRTLAGYARSGERFRLYALVYVFTQRGLDAEAERVIREISADAAVRDVTGMIIRFCGSEQPEATASLLRAILKKPELSGVTPDATVELARHLEKAQPVIFETVAAWRPHNVSEFEGLLSGTSNTTAQEFRDTVAALASGRADGGDIADLADWLHSDTDTRRGGKRTDALVAGTTRRHEPELLTDLIGRLRERKSWWTLRDYFKRHVNQDYDAPAMARLIAAAGERRCLPSALWLAQDWLTDRMRTDAEVVQVVGSLHEAHVASSELQTSLRWAAQAFRPRPDQTDPVRALDAARLAEEANAWYDGKRRKVRLMKRPDPDPPR
jgi:hypothetical protein